MKLSKRGLRGVLFYYAMIFIGVGLFFFTEAVPEEIWAPIFIVGGLVILTIFGYKLGAPILGSDDAKMDLSLKRLFRRGPARSVRRK